MVRIMGLPSVARYRVAQVAQRDDRFEIVFSGEEGTRTVDVPYRLFGTMDDLEALELRLLADLQKLGYKPTRLTP